MDFNSWAAKHGKKYSVVEALRRKAIFNQNAKLVAKFNKEHSFQLSVEGPFADMTNEEYRKLLTISEEVHTEAQEQVAPVNRKAASSVDWRSQGKVTPIRDQAQCGSCYSFSSIGALESRYLIAKGSSDTSLDLSEQQIVDCSSNNGCNGGSLEKSYMYVKQHGSTTEQSYPYTAVQGQCKSFTPKVKITGYSQVKPAGSEDSLVLAIEEGPVAVCIDASHISFQLYNGGVYDEPKCTQKITHGVIAVGYGAENGQDYYLVKNSWGTSWGEAGYIKMSRNKNNQCAIASVAFYPTGCGDY
jgi:histolysain